MMTYTEINAKVCDKTLSNEELTVLREFIDVCTEKIKSQFPAQDTIYVPIVIINDTFRNKKIPAKRQAVILGWLEKDANESGWKMVHEEDYYQLTKNK
jgi:hypothetical protein